jgi:hypothetical protein
VQNVVARQTAAGQTSALTHGSYFHDGDNVLQEVKDWHTMLGSSLRIGDNMTNKVPDLIEQDMLVPDHNRITAKELLQKLNTIVEQELAQESGIPKTIQDFFDNLQNDVEEQARETEEQGHLATSQVIQSNKHRKINMHRLAYLTTKMPTRKVISSTAQSTPAPQP